MHVVGILIYYCRYNIRLTKLIVLTRNVGLSYKTVDSTYHNKVLYYSNYNFKTFDT